MKIDELKRIFGSTAKSQEILCLLHGLKPVVRQGFYDHEIGRVKDFCRKHHLAIEIAPYKVVLSDPHQRYSNKGFKAKINDPRRGMYFVYISRDARKAGMANAYEYKDNHEELGKLLGYPGCCIEMFLKNEPERNKLDNDYTICTFRNSEGNKFSFYNNILKRPQDKTLLSHFPCSFNCKPSEDLGRRFYRLIAEIDPEQARVIYRELKRKVKINNRDFEFQ